MKSVQSSARFFERERQLEIEQKALDAAVEQHGYDGEALMHSVYYPEQS
jgi:hypothetical protein